MERKNLKFLLILILVITLTMADFILLGNGIVLAIQEDLENQNTATNVKNVLFDAYFANNGQNVHTKEGQLNAEETLILNVNVKEKGLLKDAKIKIENKNFEILKDKVENRYVKNINLETGEIELNEIIYQNNAIIALPIQFKKQENFEEDYFERENTIFITGIYENTNQQKVSGEVKTKMIWKQETDVTFSSNIEKFIDLGEKGVLLQQKVTTQVVDDALPRQKERLDLVVPSFEDKVPEKVTVLLDGEKLPEEQVNYQKEEKTLQIRKENKGIWGKANCEYKIIYQYAKGLPVTESNFSSSIQMTTQLYTQQEIQKSEDSVIEIKPSGSIVSLNKSATNQIYKGYLYANSSNETYYDEYNEIEISEASSIETIEMTQNREEAMDESENYFDLKDKTWYHSTIVNQEEINQLLGENGVIRILDEQDNLLTTIDKQAKVDENGNIVISYEEPVKGIKIVTSKPVEVGALTIKNKKSIEGNTGYRKEQLKQFQILSSSTKVETNQGVEIAKGNIKLLDSKTEANIQLDKKELSTLNTNENVQMMVTMKNASAQYDLYKNPYMEIELPEAIEDIRIKQIHKLYDQELEIKNPRLFTRDGKKVISMELQGTQTAFNEGEIEGTQVIINADITLKKETATGIQNMYLNYTNENGEEASYQAVTNFMAKSKYGVMAYRKITGISDSPIEEYDNKTMQVELNIQDHEKTANIEQTFINNYEENVENFVMVTKLSEKSDSFHGTLTGPITSNRENAKIYYFVNDNWYEKVSDYSQVEAYKIEYKEDRLLPGEMLKITYSIKIPNGLGYEEENNEQTNVTYTYKGQENKVEFSTKYKTVIVSSEEKNVSLPNQNKEEGYQEVEGIGKVKVTAMSAGKVLEDGEEVYEGQTIKYVVEVINDTVEDIKGLSIVATHNNAIFYDIKVEKEENTATFEEMEFTSIIQNPDLKQKEYNAEVLKVGELIVFEYEFLVKQNAGGNTKGTITIQGNEKQTTMDTISNHIVDGKLQIIAEYAHSEETLITSTSAFSTTYIVTNIAEENLKDVVLEVNIPKYCKLRENMISAYNTETGRDDVEVELLSNQGKSAKIKISNIESGKTVNVSTTFEVTDMPTDLLTEDITISANGIVGDETYVSNIIEKEIHQDKTDIVITQTGNIKKDTVVTGDKLIYKATIENKGIVKDNLIIADEVPAPAVIQNVYYNKNDERIEIKKEDIVNNSIGIIETIQPGEKIQLYIETQIDEQKANEDTITNIITASGKTTLVESNKVTYKINPQEQSQNSISGIAWLDENKDGERQGNEPVMKNMTVVLLDTKQNEIKSTTTNEKGAYTFFGLSKGTYMVAFKYDTTKYYLTEYQKENVESYLNSDVIAKQIKGEQFAVTDLLKIEDNYVTADAGFIESPIFDLRLDKLVNKITLQSNARTIVYSYNNTQLAKIELNAKNINNSKVTIEYQIKVTNEGEIAGYVEDIIDYLPAGMTLEDKNWTLENTNELHNRTLVQQEIVPGETKEVTLTLNKTLTPENIGTIINIAEIGRASNAMLIADMDSVPNNKVEKEDDISRADVILSVGTGITAIISIGVITLILALMGVTVYCFKKRRKDSNESSK